MNKIEYYTNANKNLWCLTKIFLGILLMLSVLFWGGVYYNGGKVDNSIPLIILGSLWFISIFANILLIPVSSDIIVNNSRKKWLLKNLPNFTYDGEYHAVLEFSASRKKYISFKGKLVAALNYGERFVYTWLTQYNELVSCIHADNEFIFTDSYASLSDLDLNSIRSEAPYLASFLKDHEKDLAAIINNAVRSSAMVPLTMENIIQIKPKHHHVI